MDDSTEIKNRPPGAFKSNERFSGGFILLLVGGALLARQLGVVLPDWLFTWPMILILVGLFIGIQLRFRNPGWLVPTFIGGVFLLDQVTPDVNLIPFIFPIIIIALGLFFIFRPRTRSWHSCNRGNKRAATLSTTDIAAADRSDFIDATAVFGGVKKIVLSKNFRGGDITNFMGGSEINLTQADFNGRVHIDTTNVFGGTKLIVPAHWDVQSEIVAVFGGVDDKRRLNGVTLDPNKVVVLDGTCLFGGIEISSY
jgi:predicted membrane protein